MVNGTEYNEKRVAVSLQWENKKIVNTQTKKHRTATAMASTAIATHDNQQKRKINSILFEYTQINATANAAAQHLI